MNEKYHVKKVAELNIDEEMIGKHFRVAMFGSARIKEGDKVYQEVFELAKMLAEKRYDVITGGGPGIMEAANAGHIAGDTEGLSESIGLGIELAHEQTINDFVEFRKNFDRFAERLETFAKLSSVFVVCPGGIGTMLELFYCWQLVQVKKMPFKPIILVGEMWERLIYWVIDYALKDNLISASDFNYIHIVKTNAEAVELISRFKQQLDETGEMSSIRECKMPKDGFGKPDCL